MLVFFTSVRASVKILVSMFPVISERRAVVGKDDDESTLN
jgi:hypothetical protein